MITPKDRAELSSLVALPVLLSAAVDRQASAAFAFLVLSAMAVYQYRVGGRKVDDG